MIDDAEVLKRLEMISTPGALNRYLWENPERWVEMHKWILEDSEQNPEAGIGDVSAMFGGLTIGGAKEQRRVYGKWNLSHIEEQYRLAVVGLLHHASWLSEEQFNFLTAGDRFGVIRPDKYTDHFRLRGETTLAEFGDHIIQQFKANPEHKRLAIAFAKQMVDEAQPHRQRCIVGQFDMDRIPLERLDNLFTYHSLRMVIDSRGIAASLVGSNSSGVYYAPFVWTPEYFSGWSLGGEESWALQVMMSCIWRDACVVKHKFYEQRAGAGHRNNKKQRRQSKLVLPRQIAVCSWAADSERQRIVGSQSVRAHYRELPDGWNASQSAIDFALLYGYPAPPDGWTFVQPHQRGDDAVSQDQSTKVVCTGLRVAKVALG